MLKEYNKELKDINKKCIYQKIPSVYYIKDTCKSKKKLESLDMELEFIYNFENNDIHNGYMIFFIQAILENLKKYKEYIKKYEELYNSLLEEKQKTSLFIKKLKIKFVLIPKYKLFKKKPYHLVDIVYSVNYTSPAKRNSYTREIKYELKEFFEIYQRYKVREKQKNLKKLFMKKQRAEVTPKLRLEILQKGNFTCVYCGRSSRDGYKLHVDHIIPVSKGGETTMKNLQVLCEECNLGKSNNLVVY